MKEIRRYVKYALVVFITVNQGSQKKSVYYDFDGHSKKDEIRRIQKYFRLIDLYEDYNDRFTIQHLSLINLESRRVLHDFTHHYMGNKIQERTIDKMLELIRRDYKLWMWQKYGVFGE